MLILKATIQHNLEITQYLGHNASIIQYLDSVIEGVTEKKLSLTADCGSS